MSTLAANECRRQVRYDYTSEERIAKATGLAEALNRSTATENEKKRIAKDYDSRLDIIQAEIDTLNNSVLSGYELREYLCFWTYDDPRPGRKTLRKREGFEVVGEEDMTERDRQMVMDIIDAQAAKGDAFYAAKPLALAEGSDWPMNPDVFDNVQVGPEEEWITGIVRDLFADVDDTILPREVVTERVRDMVATTPDAEVIRMVAFIADKDLTGQPGWGWLHSFLLPITQAMKERKKKSRRRAACPGTVDIPADEGSRDDAGEDSKNNL